MKTLVVSSTLFEIAALIERETGRHVEGMGTAGTLINGTWCDFLVSGVGPVACGVHVTRVLATAHYDQIVQAGIGGSFVADLPVGSVVVVSEEAFGDLGAESNGSFLDLFEMKLLSTDQAPFINRLLVAPPWEISALKGVPRVRAVTLNRTLSEPHSISWIAERYSPQVANMEGAAMFYAALLYGVRFLSLRAISDMVGPRDRGAWKIAESVSALDRVLQGVMGELSRVASCPP